MSVVPLLNGHAAPPLAAAVVMIVYVLERKPLLLQLALHAPAVQLPTQSHGAVLLQASHCTVPFAAAQAAPPPEAALVTVKVLGANPELVQVALHAPIDQLPAQLTGGGQTPAKGN
jgi:hypothetical protein